MDNLAKSKSYLILGYKESGKTELAKYVMDKIQQDYEYVDLDVSANPVIDKNKSYVIDNYSTKHKKIKFKLDPTQTLILISPYR